MTVLARNQVELRADTPDALVIGPATSYQWVREGPRWWASAQIRDFDEDRAGAHGVTPGRDLRGTHAATIQVQITAATQAELADRIDAWKAATAIESDELLAVRARLLDDETRVRFGRFRVGGEIDAKDGPRGHYAIGSAQFVTLDGLTYSDTEQAASTTRVLPGEGVELPAELPIEFPASATGALSIVNAGTAPGFWRARLSAPLSQPVIEHLESGRRLALTANGGVNLTGGQFLDLDSRSRSVLLNGTADRRSQLAVPPPERWAVLARGTNTFRLTATDGDGLLTVFGRHAYHS